MTTASTGSSNLSRALRWTLVLTLLALAGLFSTAARAQEIALTLTLPDGRVSVARLDPARRWSTFDSKDGPRVLGAHAFFEMTSADAGAVTLFVSNAACDAKGKQHPGLTFFRSIDFAIGSKWQYAREYGTKGAALVPAPAVGVHMMPSGRGLVFRFAVWRGDNRRAAIYALNRTTSFDADDPKWWGPARTVLPSIPFDYEPSEKATLRRLFNCLSTGAADKTVDMRRGALGGVWHLPGDETAYEFGGFEINTVWGWRRAPSSFLRERLISDRWAERIFWCFDIDTGEPADSEFFARGNGTTWQPFEMYADGNAKATDSDGRRTNLPPAFNVPPFNTGTCVYRADLERIEGVDIAHDVRGEGHTWAAWSLGRDPFAGFKIRAHTNYVRLAWSDKGRPRFKWEIDSGAQDYRSSLSAMIERAEKNPGRGSADRRFAWALANACAMRWIAPTKAELAKADAWIAALLRYDALVSLPTGLVGNFGPGGIQGAWDPTSTDGAGIPKNKNATQCFHEALRIYWVLAALKTTGQVEPSAITAARARQPNLRAVIRAADSMWFNPNLTWNGSPPHYVVTAIDGKVLAEIANPGYGAPSAFYDPAHVEPCLARFAVLLGDANDRTRISQMGTADENAKRARCLEILQGKVPYADPAWVVEEYAVLLSAIAKPKTP